MAVTVYGDPKTQGQHEHADGEDIDVRDGHLLVTARNGASARRVAIYVPGTWLRAEVTK